jgi:hypothetical protein
VKSSGEGVGASLEGYVTVIRTGGSRDAPWVARERTHAAGFDEPGRLQQHHKKASNISQFMLIRLFQHTTICWGLGLKRQVRKVHRIPDAVVRGRSACGAEAKESLEGSHGLLSAIVPKDELVEIGLEVRAAECR